jgi:hypothetical protein
MGNWNGLIYNEGLGLNDNLDWLEITRLNLKVPAEDLIVNDYNTDTAPTQSFIRLVNGTSASPTNWQCRSIEDVGVTKGSIIIVKGVTGTPVTMIHSSGNMHLDTSAVFSLSTYSTMVLVCTGSQWYEISRSDNN